ncbi:bacteriocin-like protein [Chryseobacterium tructae]
MKNLKKLTKVDLKSVYGGEPKNTVHFANGRIK